MRFDKPLVGIGSLSLSCLFAMALASCGGGSSGDAPVALATAPSPAPAPAPATPPPSAIPGDPVFASSCANTPTRAAIGPFSTQAGDCVVSYQISDAELAEFHGSFLTAPVRLKIINAVKANFKSRIDTVLVILDQDSTQQGTLPFGINYPVQSCSVHNPACPRFGRLGNLWLVARDYISTGPSLHELLHGYHVDIAADTTTGYTIPTVDSSHWGFSSAGGQHGGWARDSLTPLGGGLYMARRPKPNDGLVWGTGFSTNANGGNSVLYSNIELWTMGLIPDAELLSVDVAENAVRAASDKFTASAIRTYTSVEIILRVKPESRPSTSTPRAMRGLVVVATTAAVLPTGTLTKLNQDIEEFTQIKPSVSGTSYNFWSATGMRSTLHLATASELALP